MEAQIHFGLNIAQKLAVLDTTRLELALQEMRGLVEAWHVRLGSQNHEVLLTAPDVFGLTVEEARVYNQELFVRCLAQGEEEATVENNLPVFPVRFPAPDRRDRTS